MVAKFLNLTAMPVMYNGIVSREGQVHIRVQDGPVGWSKLNFNDRKKVMKMLKDMLIMKVVWNDKIIRLSDTKYFPITCPFLSPRNFSKKLHWQF